MDLESHLPERTPDIHLRSSRAKPRQTIVSPLRAVALRDEK